jgi:hypothetical protein
MANRKDFYFRQRVTEAELDSAFDDLEQADRDLAADLGLAGVLANAVVSPHAPVPDLTVDVSGPGTMLDPAGQRIFFSALQNVDVSQDENAVTTAVTAAGNEKVVSVFAKFDRALSDPRVDGNSLTVFFERDESFELVAAQGAEAPAGFALPPPLRSDAVLLADITRSYGQTQILASAISAARRQDAFVAAGTPRSIRRGQVSDAIADLLGFYNAHVSGVADQHPSSGGDYGGGGAWADGTPNPPTTIEAQLDKIISDLGGTSGGLKVGAGATSGTPNSLNAGSVKTQIDALLGLINDLSQGPGSTSASTVIYAGGGAWADGTTNPSTSVEAQLDKIIADLAATSGAPKIGAAATSGSPNSLTAGSVKSQINALLSALNSHVTGAGAHAASVISNTPAGNISSTTVQAALNELDSEKAGLGHTHAGTDVTYGGGGTLADGSVIGAQSFENAFNTLVALLADNVTAGSDGAGRVGAEGQSYGSASVSRGRLSSQVYELLQLINGKASVTSANTWSQPQTMSGEPGVQYPSTTTWRQLLYIPGYTPLRIAFDGSSLWITINAYYSGGVWNPDVIGSNRSAIRLDQYDLYFHYQGGGAGAFASWARTWRWSLVGGKTHPEVIGCYETGYWALEGKNYYGTTTVYLGVGVNFKSTFSATPSSITLTRDYGYNWDATPSPYAAQPYGFDCYGSSNSIGQGASAYVNGHYYAY